jgi:GNAT superfamily N-acetyltransferase
MTSRENEAKVIALAERGDQRVDLCIATGADTDAVVALYDEAVAWLAARGRSDQWGATPFSSRRDIVALIRARTECGTMWVARSPAQILGAIVLGAQAPHYIDQPAEEAEIYVSGVIASRAPNARGIGQVLLEHAAAMARRASTACCDWTATPVATAGWSTTTSRSASPRSTVSPSS